MKHKHVAIIEIEYEFRPAELFDALVGLKIVAVSDFLIKVRGPGLPKAGEGGIIHKFDTVGFIQYRQKYGRLMCDDLQTYGSITCESQ